MAEFAFGKIKDDFYLDGEPFKILSGAIHYFRIPAEDWYHSLYNLKALGFNTLLRSEERRVGKECRSRWSPYH